MAKHDSDSALIASDERESAPGATPAIGGFLPSQPARAAAESVLVRMVATAGVVGIGTAVGAILSSQDVAGWADALVVSVLSVGLAAILWRSRRL